MTKEITDAIAAAFAIILAIGGKGRLATQLCRALRSGELDGWPAAFASVTLSQSEKKYVLDEINEASRRVAGDWTAGAKRMRALAHPLMGGSPMELFKKRRAIYQAAQRADWATDYDTAH